MRNFIDHSGTIGYCFAQHIAALLSRSGCTSTGLFDTGRWGIPTTVERSRGLRTYR